MNPDERIASILATTRQLLSEKGYEHVLTTEIATRCGISEAAIYKYFATKRDLLVRVAEQWFTELIETEHRAKPMADIRQQLRQQIWESLSIVRREPSLSRFVLMDLRADPSYRSTRIFQLNRQFSNRILNTLQSAIATGEFRDDVSAHLVRYMIFGGIEHQTWAYLRGEGDFDVDLVADGIANVIYRGMSKSSADASMEIGQETSHSKSNSAAKTGVKRKSTKTTKDAI